MDDRTASSLKSAEILRGTETGFGLPPGLLEKSRRRVQIIALLVLFGSGLDLILMLARFAARGFAIDPAEHASRIPFYGNIVTVLLSLGWALVARSRRIRSSILLDLALVFEIVFSFVISVTNPVSVYEKSGTLPMMTWVTPLITFYPLIVACPPRRTLITGSR